MILTIIRLSWLRLWSNKIELGLALGVPIVFFSLFAVIFTRGIGQTAGDAIELVVVDEVDSSVTKSWLDALDDSDSVVLKQAAPDATSDKSGRSNDVAKSLMLQENTTLVLWIHDDDREGNDDAHIEAKQPSRDSGSPHLTLYTEGSDPVSPAILKGVLLAAVSATPALAPTETPAALANKNSVEEVEPVQVRAISINRKTGTTTSDSSTVAIPSIEFQKFMQGTNPWSPVLVGFASDRLHSIDALPRATDEARLLTDDATSLVGLEADMQRTAFVNAPSDLANIKSFTPPTLNSISVFGPEDHGSKVAMYAAGIAVMFLLFSATGQGGTLLEEREAGTLERLLTSQLTVGQLLFGKWCYIVMLGALQLTLMFAWAQCVFGVDWLGHLPGFIIMTLVTAGASASVAMFLATLCRSRSQLNGVSVVLILTMSAMGGSMIPRYLMSDALQQWGKLTFNAWAIDGFHKVFWQDAGLNGLLTEVTVLGAMAVGLGVAARIVAGRRLEG